MTQTQMIELVGVAPPSGPVRFLQAVVFREPRLPFALVRYCVAGKREATARLDLDKQVFLDHFEEADIEGSFAGAAALIVEHLSEVDRGQAPPRSFRTTVR